MLSNEEIQHIAKLARLGLKDGEAEKFLQQLNDILGYVEQLKEVDTEGVEPTSQVTGLENVSRTDVVEPFVRRKSCWDVPNFRLKGTRYA